MLGLRAAAMLLVGACGSFVAGQQPDPSPPRVGEAAYRDVLARVAAYERQRPQQVRRVAIGTSSAGRPLFVLRVGEAGDGAPEVYVQAGIHGHEGSELDALWLVDRLLANAADPEVAGLLHTRVLWIQPVANPDGLVAGQRQNGRGVDLNRNFGVRWRARPGAPRRDDPGAAPFSEPEARAVRDFLAGRRELRAFVDLHRSIDAVIPARGDDDRRVDEAVRAAAEALDAAMGGRSHRDGDQLPVFVGMDGLAVDWVYGELGVMAFAIESRGDAGQAPASDALWSMLRHVLQRAGDYPRARATGIVPRPYLVTDRTRASPAELARLTAPGTVLFADGFESAASFRSYFEIGGLAEGRVRIAHEPDSVHSGTGALQLTSTDSGGRSCGAGPVAWLGDAGHECLHLRYWIRYAADYDQGNLHHTGGSLAAVAGTDKWAGMGSAGRRPVGNDHFSTRVEGWRDWGRVAAPGFLHCYTYWMDMRQDRDGNFWGNMLGPKERERCVPERGAWQCVELRVACNTPGLADGELAVWLDGRLYVHYQGCRWRKSEAVRLKRVGLLAYVHEARRDNRVWFDDVVVATGYIGTGTAAAGK